MSRPNLRRQPTNDEQTCDNEAASDRYRRDGGPTSGIPKARDNPTLRLGEPRHGGDRTSPGRIRATKTEREEVELTDRIP
jgi:hypothetical protein